MTLDRVRALMVYLIPMGKVTKKLLQTKKELSEEDIQFLIDEEYIIPCGRNSEEKQLYCASEKGKKL